MSEKQGTDAKQGETKKAPAKKKGMWATIERVILYAGIAIFIGSILLPPSFRNSLAVAVNFVVSPFTATMPFYIVILVIGITINIFSIIIQKYTTDWELVRSVNRKFQVLNKELKEAQVAGDKKKIKKLEAEQMTIMGDQAEVSKQTMKPMFYIVFISIPLFWWEYWYLAQPEHLSLYMFFPLLGAHSLTQGFLVFPLWLWWSLLCSFPISYLIRKALNLVMQ